jgi:hypothetical protein
MSAGSKPSPARPYGSVNPFAKALAETEQSGIGNPNQQGSLGDNNLFSNALANTGNGKPSENAQPNFADMMKQQQQAEAARKKDMMRRKLHNEVNPVQRSFEQNINVFSQREKRVTEEIEKTRQELKFLAHEIAQLHKDVDLAVTQPVVHPGKDGTYYLSFFQQLRAFIMLLRQKVQSARTWAQQMQTKQAKKKKHKGGAGIDMGKGMEQTKSVHDIMHHERSTAYSGT